MIESFRVRIPEEAAGEFTSPELALCADSYSVSVPPSYYRSGTQKNPIILPKVQMAVTPKNACTLDPTKSEWADYTAVQAYCGNLSENDLTRNSSGNTRLQSSQLAEPLWTDSGLKSGISVHILISTLKKKEKKCRQGMNGHTFSQNPRKQGRSNHIIYKEPEV